MANEAHISEEKAKKAMVDAARLAGELRCEQDMAQQFERMFLSFHFQNMLTICVNV